MAASSTPAEVPVKRTTEVKPYQTMRGHTDFVTGVAHLPDGRHIITCSADGSLRLWERESGAQIGNDWRDDEGKEGVLTIALSPNGETVASGSNNGMVKLWNIETRKVIAKWTGHSEEVWSVCWSGDGERVVTGSYDGTARVWDVESGETVLGPITTGHQRVEAVAFLPDASNFATGGFENGIKIWNARTGELLSTLKQGSVVWSLVWTSDQKKLLAGHYNGSITIFNTATWQQIAILENHTGPVLALSLFQNDRLLASASGDKTARLWNLDTNLSVGPPLQHQDFIHQTALSADGRFLATACHDKNAYVWDVHSILQQAGLEDLLSILNITTGKLILDSDATRRQTKHKENLSIVPRGFFDSSIPTIDLPPSIVPTGPPPATPPPGLPPSPARSDTPPSARVRRHYLAGARALLGRVFPRLRRSQSSTAEPTELLRQCSWPGNVSIPEPADTAVPAAQDNQSDATHRLITLEHPLHRETTGQRYDTASAHLETPRLMGSHTAIKSAHDAHSRDKGITNFSNWIRPSSDTNGKHKQRRLDRNAPKVVDVPLGEATYGDYVANREEVVRPYSLFCCLSWCQKKEKSHNLLLQQYDTDLMCPASDDPVPATGGFTTQQEGLELSAIANQPEPEAGPSRLPGNAER